MQKFEDLKAVLVGIEEDIVKFTEKGNKAAGGRIRKAMQEVKKLSQEIRVDVQAAKKAETKEA